MGADNEGMGDGFQLIETLRNFHYLGNFNDFIKGLNMLLY